MDGPTRAFLYRVTLTEFLRGDATATPDPYPTLDAPRFPRGISFLGNFFRGPFLGGCSLGKVAGGYFWDSILPKVASND